MTYPNSQILWSVQDLQSRLADEDLRLFDVTVFLRPQKKGMVVESGAKIYADGHIPGAACIDQLTELSVTDAPFRFTLPPVEQLTSAFAAAGISAHHKVVFYSSGHLMWATRAWWLLRYCGHDQVAVLDGGLGYAPQGLAAAAVVHQPPLVEASPARARAHVKVDVLRDVPGELCPDDIARGDGVFHGGPPDGILHRRRGYCNPRAPALG